MTAQVDSRIVTLIQAGITFQQSDGELWGVLVVQRKDGPTRQFGQYLPCAAVPNPPGWRTIEELTGVTTQQVVDGWNDAGSHNGVAEQAFKLMGEHIGCEFLATEIEGIGGFAAVELVALRGHADLLVSNDSGPVHIAAAAGAPTVALFGPETPTLYAPLASRAGQEHAVHYLGLACSPCMFVHDNKVLSCWFAQARCMTGILASEVLGSVDALLADARGRRTGSALRAIES